MAAASHLFEDSGPQILCLVLPFLDRRQQWRILDGVSPSVFHSGILPGMGLTLHAAASSWPASAAATRPVAYRLRELTLMRALPGPGPDPTAAWMPPGTCAHLTQLYLVTTKDKNPFTGVAAWTQTVAALLPRLPVLEELVVDTQHVLVVAAVVRALSDSPALLPRLTTLEVQCTKEQDASGTRLREVALDWRALMGQRRTLRVVDLPLSLLAASAGRGLDAVVQLKTLRTSGGAGGAAGAGAAGYVRLYEAVGALAAKGALRTLVWDDAYRTRLEGWPRLPGAYLDLRRVPAADRLVEALGASGHMRRLALRLSDANVERVAAVVGGVDHVTVVETRAARTDPEALRRGYALLLGKVRSLELRNLKPRILQEISSPVVECLALVWSAKASGSMAYVSQALGGLPCLKELRVEGAMQGGPESAMAFWDWVRGYDGLRVLSVRGSLFNDHDNEVMDTLRVLLDEGQHQFWPRLEVLDVGGGNHVFARNTDWVFPLLEVASNRRCLRYLRMGQDAAGLVRRIVRARRYKYTELNGLVVSLEPLERS